MGQTANPFGETNAAAEPELSQQNLYLNALQETALGLVGRLDLSELLQTILARAGALFDTRNGYVFLLDAETGEMVMRVGVGEYEHFVGSKARRGVALAGKVWESGEPVRVDDYRTWSERLADPSRDVLRAVVGVPLKSRDRVAGILGLAHLDAEKKFGPAEMDVLGRFAALASIALDNAQLYEAAQRELTQRRATEAKLEYERDLLQALMDNIPDLIFFKDRESRFVRSNNAHLRNLGAASMDQVFGKTDLDFHVSAPAHGFLDDEKQILESGVPILNQVEANPTVDGTPRYFLTSKVPWRDQEGSVIGTLGVAHDITDRVLAEEKLEAEIAERKTTEQFLNSIVENLPTMLFAKEANELRFVRWNKAAEQISGLAGQTVLGKNDYDIVPAEEADFFTAKDRETLRGRQVVDIPEEPLQASNGEIRWLHTKKFPVLDLEGNPAFLVGISEDITEKRNTDEALRASETRFRSLAENIPSVVYICLDDERYTMLYINDEVGRLTGIPTEEFQNNQASFVDLYHPDDVAQIQANAERAIASHEPYRLVYRLKHSSGEWRWVEEFGSAVYDSTGTVLYLIGYMNDITARLESQQALRESEERYRDLFDNASDLIQSIASDGHILYVNKAWKDTLGYSDDEIQHMRFLDFVHPDGRADAVEASANLLRGESLPNLNLEYRAKDGRKLFLEGSATPRSVDGQVVSTRSIFRDVTARRLVEQQAAFQNALLGAQYQVSPDGILVVGNDDRLLSYNRRFIEMWGIPEEALKEGSAEPLRRAIGQNLADPEEWIRRSAEIYSRQDESSHDEILFKDGRIFERYSAPITTAEGEYQGRVWYFHDITANRRAEEGLRRVVEGARAVFWRASVTKLENDSQGAFGYHWDTRYSNPDAVLAFLPIKKAPDQDFADAWYNSWLEEDRVQMDLRSSNALRNGLSGYTQEYRLRDVDGNIHWIHEDARIQPVDDWHLEVVGFSNDVTERKLNEETVRRQNAYLNALQETSLGLMQRLDVNALLQDVVARAGALVGTESGYVFLADPNGDQMELRVGVGAYEEFVGRRTRRGEGLAGRVWETNAPVWVDDYREWEGRLTDPSRDILRAVIGVPMRSGEAVVGVIGLAYLDETRKFGEDEVQALQRFAQLATIALDNARLYETSRQELAERTRAESEMVQRNQELEVISRVSSVMTTDIDMVTALERMARELVIVFRARNCGIALLNPDKQSLTVVADALGEEHEEHAVGIVIPVADNPSTQYVLTHQRSIVIPDAQTDPMTAPIHERMRQRRTKCLAIVPLLSGGEVIGTIGLDTTDPTHIFGDAEIRLAETMANQMANAIEKQRLFDQTKERARREQVTREIGANMSRSLDMDTILQTMARELSHALGASHAVVRIGATENESNGGNGDNGGHHA